jgi:hydrogenase maturation protease
MRDPFPDAAGRRRLTVVGLGSPYRGDDAAGLVVARLLADDDPGTCPSGLPPGGADAPAAVGERGCPPQAARGRPAVPVVACDGEPTRLLSLWEGADEVWIVDAAVFDAPAGTVRRLVVEAGTPGGQGVDGGPGRPLAGLTTTSTHGFGLAEVLDLAGTLGSLPPRIVIYAIRGADFSPGACLSPPVAAAAHTTAALVRADLACRPTWQPGR